MAKAAIPTLGFHIPRRPHGIGQRLAAGLLRWHGWRVDAPPDLPKLVVCGVPHTSNWDGYYAMVTVLALRLRISIMIKQSMMNSPLRPLLRWVGFFGIDRSAPGGVVESTAQLMQEAQAFWFCIAPEGTRHGAKDLKSGFYRIAVAANTPISMACINYQTRHIRFTEPLQPSGDWEADRRRLLELVGSDFHPRNPHRLSAAMQEAQALSQEGSKAA
ncbi:MAG: 1-acyl-sn-glycerol-3-phosphate acyltransferase [Oceanococcaceae bacterium]